MKKIYKKGLCMLAAGALVASCADYNVTDNFKADPDPSYQLQYTDLAAVNSYIDRAKYPNMTLGTSMLVSEFNKQEMAHAAAVLNFDNVSFGKTLMSGTIVSEKGIMNFLAMKKLLDHVQEIGGNVYGSPIVSNANQADDWLNYLTQPIEIEVEPVVDKVVDYTTMTTFTGTAKSGKPAIALKYDGNDNALKLPKRSKVYIVEGFDIDPLGTYTITFYAKVDKDETVQCTFAGNQILDGKTVKKFSIKAGEWRKVVVEATPAEGVAEGYLMLEGNLNSLVYIKNVTVKHAPDNHRPQTDEERKDTIDYALQKWCDGMMKMNEGRIKTFDLIDEPLGNQILKEDILDLKHSADKIYWQDVLGSENYAPVVSKIASSAFVKYGGNAADLKFFISETGLDKESKLKSLKYWISVWEGKGAQIDGINAKLTLYYDEDEATQQTNKATIDKLIANLATTGKLIRLSNLDIKYRNDKGTIPAADLTEEQRQVVADYYAYIIKSYMNIIPNELQAGICKNSMNDNGDIVGLWSVKNSDWVRSSVYKAFCYALSGK